MDHARSANTAPRAKIQKKARFLMVGVDQTSEEVNYFYGIRFEAYELQH